VSQQSISVYKREPKFLNLLIIVHLKNKESTVLANGIITVGNQTCTY